jgi:hypothetical protein
METDIPKFSYILTTNHCRKTHEQIALYNIICHNSKNLQDVQFFHSRAMNDEFCINVQTQHEAELVGALKAISIESHKPPNVINFFVTNVHTTMADATLTKLTQGIIYVGRASF